MLRQLVKEDDMREELEPCPFCGRQAAIDALDRIFDRCEEIEAHLPEGDPDRDGYEMYPDYRTVWRYLRQLPSAQPELHWIPCSERSPKEQEKSYWVCTDSGYQCQCRWTNINHIWTQLTTDWHWHFADIPQYTKVVAWMPLPEPYKGE